MKSLEHIIRLVHEGKCSCEKKKKSLENTIRSVGKKEIDENWKSEGVKDAIKGAEILMRDPAHSLGQLVPYGKQAIKTIEKNLPAVITKTKPKAEVPAIVKTEVPVVTKTETQLVTKPTTQTITKTQPATAIPVVTPTTTAPQKSMADAMSSALSVPVAVVTTKNATKEAPAVATATKTAVAPKTEPKAGAAEPPKGTKTGLKGFIPPFFSKSYPDHHGDFFDALHMFRPPTVTHKAKKRMANESVDERKKIENMPRSDKDRREVHYVGRDGDDPQTLRSKTARNAELKHKIIDEGKKVSTLVKQIHKSAKEYREDGKTKVYPNVIINPDLNRVDLNTYIDSGKAPNDYK